MWKALAEDRFGPMEVWFLTPHAVRPTLDREFNQTFHWDVDLLSGYPHRFLEIHDGWDLDSFRGIRLRRSWSDLFREHGVTRLWVEGWRFQALWSAIRAAKRAGIEVWMRGETNDLRARSGVKEVARRLMLRYLFGKVGRFLCIGGANRRFYESFGQPSSKLCSAPYCVDNARFAAQAEKLRADRVRIRREWGIPESKFCVLFCGKFIPKKRPLDLVAAVGKLDDRFHLLFVGDGELGSALREATDPRFVAAGELTRQNPGHPTASFVGFLNQEQIAAAYVAADCLVLPSDAGETWGLVVNEAMATGLPCIVADQCGCAEDLAADGFIFPTGDVDALADCLRRMAEAPTSVAETLELIERFSPAATVRTVGELVGSGNCRTFPRQVAL